MAGNDLPLFRGLKKPDGCSIAQSMKQEGDAKAGDHTGTLTAIKPDNTLQFLNLTNDGKLIVDIGATPGQCKRATAALDAPTTLDTYEDVVVLTAALTKRYSDMQVNLNCMVETEWELYAVDDVGVGDTETILDRWMTGPGQFNIQGIAICDDLDTTGNTGAQELRVRGKNIGECLSRMTASISTIESTP